MPKSTLSGDIKKIKSLFTNFFSSKKSDKYKITPQQIADDIVTGFEYGSSYNQIFIYVKNSFSDKELNDLSKIKIEITSQMILLFPKMKVGEKIAFNILLSKIKTQEKQKSTNLFQEQQRLQMRGSNSSVYYDADNNDKQKFTNLSQEKQPLTSRRDSNATIYYDAQDGSESDDTPPPPKTIKTYPILPPIVAKPKKEAVKPFTEVIYKKAIETIEKNNGIVALSSAFGVKFVKVNRIDKEELAGTIDFTSSIGGVFGGNILNATSFSRKCEDNFNACKKNYATMLPFCHIKDIMDLKTKDKKLHDALSDSPLSASLFLTDKTVKLNTPESLNAAYNDFKNHGLNDFNTIAGDILSDAQKEDNKEIRDILSANVLFYSDENVDKNGKKYSTKSQNATNEALEKSKICQDIIIELVLKNPDAMKNINIMIYGKKELTEYADKAGTSFDNTNIKKLFVEKMPQKIQEWQKWIELGKDIDCDLYPEFGKFKQNVYELSQECIKDLDNKINDRTLDNRKKEGIKKLRQDFNKTTSDAFPQINTVRSV